MTLDDLLGSRIGLKRAAVQSTRALNVESTLHLSQSRKIDPTKRSALNILRTRCWKTQSLRGKVAVKVQGTFDDRKLLETVDLLQHCVVCNLVGAVYR